MIIEQILDSLKGTAPLLMLLGGGLLVLIADVLLPSDRRRLLPTLATLAIAFAFCILHLMGRDGWIERAEHYSGALSTGYLVFLAQNVVLGAGLFVTLISPRYLRDRAIAQGEYYALLLFATAAAMALSATTELLTLFLNIELLSITLYVMAGMEKRQPRASEAAFKYFLLGSFASAFLLLGIAFLFGATGETRYSEIETVLSSGKVAPAADDGLLMSAAPPAAETGKLQPVKRVQPLFVMIGFALILIGFGFKLTLAPFHMYAPDVYDGAPLPVATWIATGSKIGGFAALFHLVEAITRWADAPPEVTMAFPEGLWFGAYVIVVISLIVGNVGAVVQPNIKRLLAYSSIAHSAYTLIPFVVLLKRPDLIEEARTAVGYYLMAYTVMTLAAFGAIAALGREAEDRIEDYAGLARRRPFVALVMGLALLSLLGVPPTVGFIGKLKLFGLAVAGDHVWLAVLGVLASVMSAYYYLRIIVLMTMQEAPAEGGAGLAPPRWTARIVLGVTAAALFVFAIFPEFYMPR